MKANEWINAKDKLPSNERPVLVYMPELGMNIQVAFYTRYYGEDDGEWHEGWVAKGIVTHWMKLPEPPKGDK